MGPLYQGHNELRPHDNDAPHAEQYSASEPQMPLGAWLSLPVSVRCCIRAKWPVDLCTGKCVPGDPECTVDGRQGHCGRKTTVHHAHSCCSFEC